MNRTLRTDILPTGETIVCHLLLTMVFAVVVDFFCCCGGLYWRVLFGLDGLVGCALVSIFGRGLDKCVSQVGQLLHRYGVQ